MTARWSKTPPTVPGWYWLRGKSKQVTCGYLGKNGFEFLDGMSTVDFLVRSDAEFAGPIEPPREGGGACERMPPCACCGCPFSAHVIEGRIGECVALRLRSDVDSEDVCECDMYIIPDPELP